METRVIKLADIKPAPYNPRVQLTPKDQEYKALDASIEENGLVLSVLSMQFMPTAYRPRMLKQIYDGLTDGGALIFVEKILSENMDDLMVDLYYEMKRENGYTDEQIMSKRRSLENVLSPLKAEWSVDMMRTAGFRQVDMFWRCLNFCGWIAVK